MPPREHPLSEADARQLAWEYRQKFRDREAFDAAWQALFELKTAITPALSRRFLQEELVKFRARLAGLEEAPTAVAEVDRSAHPYECPGCQRMLDEWSRAGHAETCPYIDCYGLEVRFRHGKAIAAAARNTAKANA